MILPFPSFIFLTDIITTRKALSASDDTPKSTLMDMLRTQKNEFKAAWQINRFYVRIQTYFEGMNNILHYRQLTFELQTQYKVLKRHKMYIYLLTWTSTLIKDMYSWFVTTPIPHKFERNRNSKRWNHSDLKAAWFFAASEKLQYLCPACIEIFSRSTTSNVWSIFWI